MDEQLTITTITDSGTVTFLSKHEATIAEALANLAHIEVREGEVWQKVGSLMGELRFLAEARCGAYRVMIEAQVELAKAGHNA